MSWWLAARHIQLDMRMPNAHCLHMIHHASVVAAPRRATNVTLPEPMLREARDLGINLSQACERGLAAAVAEERRKRWLADNREAAEAWNRHVAEHGLPLDAYRQF